MPFYNNAAQGTTRYSPTGFYDSGLLLDANSASVTNSTTVVTAVQVYKYLLVNMREL